MAPEGTPLIADSTNNCGCYYLALPDERRVRNVRSRFWVPDPLVPAWLPEAFPSEPLHWRIASGWHQVQHVDARALPDTGRVYELLPYDQLELLPASGGRESVFGRNGIMKDSTRIEPYFFFSMGIPGIGKMRQRGNHPITLVGRAHFTDPQLFNDMFEFR